VRLDPTIETRVCLGESVECPACGHLLRLWIANHGLKVFDCNTPNCPVYTYARNRLYARLRAIEGLYP